jgi:hypothetical protein
MDQIANMENLAQFSNRRLFRSVPPVPVVERKAERVKQQAMTGLGSPLFRCPTSKEKYRYIEGSAQMEQGLIG